jgi:hypothetical protein
MSNQYRPTSNRRVENMHPVNSSQEFRKAHEVIGADED